MNTIILSDEDTKIFLEFQKNYQTYAVLAKELNIGVGYGKLIMNFAGGILQNVVREEIVYRKG